MKPNPLEELTVLEILKQDPQDWTGPEAITLAEHFRKSREAYLLLEDEKAKKKDLKQRGAQKEVDPDTLGDLL